MYQATQKDQISYAVTYGEFMYQAGSWKYPRRVVFKIEKPYGQLTHMYTFIVTNMDMEPYQIIQFYCGRGNPFRKRDLSQLTTPVQALKFCARFLRHRSQNLPFLLVITSRNAGYRSYFVSTSTYNRICLIVLLFLYF